MTAVLLPNGKQQFFTAPGVPAVGYKLATFAAGTSAPQATWVDAGQIGANTNPIILDARGEAVIFWNGAYKVQLQDSNGAPIWTVDNVNSTSAPSASQVPTVDNSFNLGSPTFRWANVYAGTNLLVGPNLVPVLDTVSGSIGYWKQTAAEAAAAVTPSSFSYPPYDVRRYGAVGDGATNDSTAFNLAGTIGLPIFVPDPPVSWLLNSDITGTFQSFNYPKTSGGGRLTLRDLSMSDADNIADVAAALEAGTATRLATFGDSTMWGALAGPLTQVATPPYAQMAGAINNFFGNSACTAINYAISGTTLNQMLKGTDGSGLTFAARIAAEAAPIIFCNHGQNDAAGGGGLQTTAAVYRANLVAFIRIVRAAGKTPVLVTPHPSLTIGTFGSQLRAETVSRFADIMRDVATQHGVRLVDNFKWLRLLMGTLQTLNQANINLPLTYLPDGVHGVQATYTFTGNNLCDALLSGMTDSFTGPDQRILATRPFAQATGQIFGSSTSSYGNASVVANNAGGTGAQSLRMLFRTEATGLDISILHPIYSALAGGVTINLDGATVGPTFSQVIAGFTVANYLQDVETTIARNIAPGWHQITITTAGPGALSINGLRSRATNRPIMLGNGTQDMSQRQLITPKLQVQAGAGGNVLVMTDYAVSRFTEALELEWTGQMVKNSQVVCAADTGSPSGAAATERMIGFGLNGSGFCQINEATAPGTYTTPAALDAVDHSGASHTYRVILTNANPGTIQMFVDDVSVGTQALTQPFLGGWLGVWKNLNTDVLTLTNVSRVWHF